MPTIQDLQNLSNGMLINSPVAASQTVIVTNPGDNGTPCLPCEDNTCEVTPTQAVTLDVGRFNRSNSKIRARIDTTGADDPTLAQTLVVFADYSIGDSENFPQDAAYFLPPIGEGSEAASTRLESTAATAASTNLVSTADFTAADVGSSVVSSQLPAGTTIIAFINTSNVTLSQAATAGDGMTFVSTAITNQGGEFVPNGVTINSDPAAGWISNLNNNISGGAVLSTIVIQYNATTYPELDNLEIIAGHNPLDPSVAPVVVNQLNPLCDSCNTNTVGNFTTHTYNVSHGISWRDWVALLIPASEAGVIFTVDFCFGAVGLPNTQMDTYVHQAS